MNKIFEEAIKDLEEVVRKLEDGTVSLDESLQLFEKGVELARLCRAKLISLRPKLRYCWSGMGVCN